MCWRFWRIGIKKIREEEYERSFREWGCAFQFGKKHVYPVKAVDLRLKIRKNIKNDLQLSVFSFTNRFISRRTKYCEKEHFTWMKKK